MLSPPTPAAVIFCAHIPLRRGHDLKAWNSRGIAAVICDQPFFFLDKGIIGEGMISGYRGIAAEPGSGSVLERTRAHKRMVPMGLNAT